MQLHTSELKTVHSNMLLMLMKQAFVELTLPVRAGLCAQGLFCTSMEPCLNPRTSRCVENTVHFVTLGTVNPHLFSPFPPVDREFFISGDVQSAPIAFPQQ